MNTVRLTDEIPVMVFSREEGEVPALVHPYLSTNLMAKVTFEDGKWKDVRWYKVRQINVSELMDQYEWGDE